MASLVSKPVVVSVRPQAVARPIAAQAKPRLVLTRATAPKKEQIVEAIKEAEDTCAGGTTGECAAAWDTVEELSAAASHAKDAVAADPNLSDPLEKFCGDNPDADECKVYED